MPIYTYRCCECGRTTDAYRTVETRAEAPECCGEMRQIIAPAYIAPDLPEYTSPITGKPVCGRKQRREDLKRSGCREVDPSERRDFGI